jgi:hypothetical protein
MLCCGKINEQRRFSPRIKKEEMNLFVSVRLPNFFKLIELVALLMILSIPSSTTLSATKEISINS